MEPTALIGAAIGAALVVLATAYGISSIGAKAMEGIARQPQAAGPIRTAMIFATALIEGAGMFGLAICFMIASSASKGTPPPSKAPTYQTAR